MKQLFLLIAICTLAHLVADGQSPESNEAMYNAYLTQEVKSAKESWKKVVAANQAICDRNPNDTDALYSLALAQFGLLSATMRDQDEDLFDTYVDKTEKNLETLIEKNKTWGEPRALLSALYGLKMGYSPWKGMYLGAKSSSLMDKARKDTPNSPLVWKLYANSKFFTPETWGGDLKEAIKAYEKSIQLYESDPERKKFNWFYLDTFAFLGQAYQKEDNQSKAVNVYKKALEVEPEFGWVKYNLLPKAGKGESK